jgi:hypothetical protein
MGYDLDTLAEKLPGAHRYEKYVACICPFHQDRKPSCLVYPDYFYCTACGTRGPTAVLLRQVGLHPTSGGEVESDYLPDIFGRDPGQLVESAHRFLVEHEDYQDYLKGRGLESAITLYHLGYFDGWFTIPTYNRSRELGNIYFRAGRWVQLHGGRRFYQFPGQKPAAYFPDWKLIKKAEKHGLPLFVTFGLFDAITLCLLGYAAVTPTTGKDSFRSEWLDFFQSKIVVLPDLGEERAANMLSSKLDWRGGVFYLDYPEDCKDPNDFLIHNHIDELRRQLELVISLTTRRRSGVTGSYRTR